MAGLLCVLQPSSPLWCAKRGGALIREAVCTHKSTNTWRRASNISERYGKHCVTISLYHTSTGYRDRKEPNSFDTLASPYCTPAQERSACTLWLPQSFYAHVSLCSHAVLLRLGIRCLFCAKKHSVDVTLLLRALRFLRGFLRH